MNNELLRHMLSTIRYRFEKSVQGSPPTFGEFSLGKGSRSSIEIINHMYDVIYSTRFFIERGTLPSQKVEQLNLDNEIARFNAELSTVDQLLECTPLDINYAKRLIQGPFSDVLTHIGQIAMLQRLVENPTIWEDFSSSDITTGLNN
ncbi:MAG: hypothetical protein AAFN81_17480 [Bacteroidota bacterium]